ncbi:hypothetical protein LAZ67_9002227 [Cordylochernes scorpioides]|uniref:Reverse transcriptase domain-containing protein n=1 Tax=Cordylochernes scorpioides TaxID=51811 RepID=A0ABY6KU56_9ARAC|nr:hypothetical protein LAZ67_9002227 [Cordylochernes scorpioides]
MEKLPNGQEFSKLDFQSAFHQIELYEAAQEKCTINTLIATFQEDIIIAARNEEEHLISLDRILLHLEGVRIKLSRDKCQFQQEFLEYIWVTSREECNSTSTNKVISYRQCSRAK